MVMRDPTDQRPLRHYFTLKYCAFHVMVYFVLALLGWGMYVYVGLFVPLLWLQSSVRAALAAVTFVALWLLTLLSYVRTVFRDPGSVPPNCNVPTTERRYASNEPRYCQICKNIKPDRSHHCSTCGRCVLKMDHHCPWVNNCVGWRNYKFFMLFLIYTGLLGIYTCVSLLPSFVQWEIGKLESGQLQVMILIFVSGCFGVGLAFFAISHVFLVLGNQTTIESFEKHRGGITPYNVGKRRNWEQVFGKRAFLWFLPVANSVGDGLTFERHDTPNEEDTLFP